MSNKFVGVSQITKENAMKYCSLFLIVSKCLLAQGIFTSQQSLEAFNADIEIFNDDYTCIQDAIDATVHLGMAESGCSASPPFVPPVHPVGPPVDPSQPIAGPPGSLPFVIVNNSGIPDDQVFISIIGAQLIGTVAQPQKIYVTFSAGGIGAYNDVPSVGSGSVPTIALSSINMHTPGQPHTYAFYMPANSGGSDGISGARIYVQLKDGTSIITYSDGLLTEPSVLNQSLASYSIAFDKFEFAYVPAGSPQIAADATAVDFFSIPLYGFLSTPAAQHSGLYQSQSFIMGSPNGVVPSFFANKSTGPNKSAILAQWNNLFSPNQSHPIRVLSPASAMSVGTSSSFPNKFDPNYFDNAAAYGFSLIQYLWSGANAFYKKSGNGLYFQIPPSALYPQPAGGVYTASINGSNVMNFSPAFTTESQSYFPAPSTANATAPSPTNGPTSYLIFAAQNLNATFAANLQGNQVSKLFEEAMIAGLLPYSFTSSNPLSNAFLTANSSNYYNPNLPVS
ncbi:MAG TPA: beta-1,3-glucanase family protein, partial [Chlamydiales bacterium]|nr:beta-1,3-glucanase family protein [Chlamydiales bacterium]